MAKYSINKGVGNTAEFKGLKAQYLVYFIVGIVGLFLLFIILRIAGVPAVVNILLIVALGIALCGAVFYFNREYGQHGLMKRSARKHIPRFIISRKTIKSILTNK